MKEPYGEGLATHTGPESCGGPREGVGEALTGVHVGWVSSRERIHFRDADPVGLWGRQHGRVRDGECLRRSRVVVDPMHAHGARMETPRTETGRSPARPSQGTGRSASGRPKRPTPMMHGREKSDSPIVPRKPTNKAGQPVAEPVEGRGEAKGNAARQSTHRPQRRESVSQALGRVRDAVGAVRRQIPKAGARCVSSARRDLCGARGVTRVPTAIRYIVYLDIYCRHRQRGHAMGLRRLQFSTNNSLTQLRPTVHIVDRE